MGEYNILHCNNCGICQRCAETLWVSKTYYTVMTVVSVGDVLSVVYACRMYVIVMTSLL